MVIEQVGITKDFTSDVSRVRLAPVVKNEAIHAVPEKEDAKCADTRAPEKKDRGIHLRFKRLRVPKIGQSLATSNGSLARNVALGASRGPSHSQRAQLDAAFVAPQNKSSSTDP